MENKNLEVTFVVDQPASVVFDAITSVSKWWTENLTGSSKALHDEFTVEFEGMHFSKQRLIEVVPNQKVVWLVTESDLTWIKDKSEWTDTKVVFEVTEHGGKTQLQFTHIGLVPGVECFDGCKGAWGHFVGESLFNLITAGKGYPAKKQAEKVS